MANVENAISLASGRKNAVVVIGKVKACRHAPRPRGVSRVYSFAELYGRAADLRSGKDRQRMRDIADRNADTLRRYISLEECSLCRQEEEASRDQLALGRIDADTGSPDGEA